MIYLGSDHRGFKLKAQVGIWLYDWGYSYTDFGPETLNPDDDYTTYTERVASVVGREKDAHGILLCGSGVGVDATANKFDGVRASVGKSAAQVKAGRNDDDMNILVLAADFTTADEAKEIVKAFLETEYSKVARHERRLGEIKKIEANN